MILKVVEEMFLVSEQQILDAMSLGLRTECRVIERSSAAAIAALGLPELRARDVTVIISGRNVEFPAGALNDQVARIIPVIAAP
jgi:threonine dehydratase